MFKLWTLSFLSLLAFSGTVNADRLIVEAEGTAFKTASLPNSIYQARAISNALKSALQSGAQSLDSFSLVENGKVLFDQISAQSNMQIAGYRVLSTKDHGNKLSARLEILLLPTKKNATLNNCRQPISLDIGFKWKGFSTKKTLPFWMQFDELSLKKEIEDSIASDVKFNIKYDNSRNSEAPSNYSLYEIGNGPTVSIPKYLVTIALNFDTTESANPIQRKKHLVVTAKSELFRKTQIINWVELQTEVEIEKSGVFVNNSISKRKGLDNIQAAVSDLALETIAQTLQHLDCKNFNGKIKLRNRTLEIDYGFQDGLLASDIFSSVQAGTTQYYFTVKQMGANSTTLHALSQDKDGQIFDGLNIRLLERF